ncbi:PREDICTED: protein LAZ1 homolog 1-like [Lupinus angustifolius]|uniref:protein LAZ1 homolog 1-like n=1 Tax=Lupinus angustifolius TaxID=3871 RepID=UPI00092FD122|nr:PREDICTED: protein LAZ1 homolog 1-like [Lupinus angustifolius]XP_019417932.1 PREDICTED: protein LAZ1 homolog 1-like [Lupinus angustifolius]XP_019417933.1 PREDICTED: protein LAZ1 homolog 1-like [Lupinus angustifolius]XP_019417934.1 PREDICTED: protein LAZ1 homolog 1-like [Lupinus angustifolius]
MGLTDILCCSIFFSTLVESTSRSVNVWPINIGVESTGTISWTVFSSSIFVLVALVLSMYLIFEHLAAYNQPEEQKFLVGLILMVPVYALESFLSLLNSSAAFNCEVIRDCYEAFALYCFERYLIACLGGEDKTIQFMESMCLTDTSTPLLKESYAYGIVEHPFPLNCLLRVWYLGPDFYQSVKIGIVQYMILKLICALLAMILQSFGVYGEGKFEWKYGYPYLACVLNFSQTWALYCLVQFYSVIKDKLEPIKPLAKFLTFKSIVFLTWWQGVAVAFLFSMGAFKGSLAQELRTCIQDYIICIEMGVSAVVHLYVFPAVPYKRGERCVRNVAVMADYASIGTPPDPVEVQDCERSTRMWVGRHNEREKRKFTHNVRDVVLGSGEIIVDDMKFTVSHVVEPVERGIAKINKTFHQISENMKRHDEERRRSNKVKDDSYLIPLHSWTTEFSDAHDKLVEGSVSDSGLSGGKRQRNQSNASLSRMRR